MRQSETGYHSEPVWPMMHLFLASEEVEGVEEGGGMQTMISVLSFSTLIIVFIVAVFLLSIRGSLSEQIRFGGNGNAERLG